MHRLDLVRQERVRRRHQRGRVLAVAAGGILAIWITWDLSSLAKTLQSTLLWNAASLLSAWASWTTGNAMERYRRRMMMRRLGWAVVAHSRSGVARPPGTFALAFCGAWAREKTLERVVRPIIADMQVEYFESLSQGRRIHAEWVRVLWMLDLSRALVLSGILEGLSKLVAGVVRRVIGR